MNWKLPNQLTVGRLVLAGIFFVFLALHDQAPDSRDLMLNLCLGIFIVAGITDILDGYLARKWNVQTAFGRITDPFVDKVLVCGAYALLAGSNFAFFPQSGSGIATVGAFESGLDKWITGSMASGVQAWMVVAVIAREFVVSGVRGYSESQGKDFPATIWGKLKMLTQTVAIGAVLFQLANFPQARWAIILKLAAVWLSVIATVLSGLAYVSKARALLVSDGKP